MLPIPLEEHYDILSGGGDLDDGGSGEGEGVVVTMRPITLANRDLATYNPSVKERIDNGECVVKKKFGYGECGFVVGECVDVLNIRDEEKNKFNNMNVWSDDFVDWSFNESVDEMEMDGEGMCVVQCEGEVKLYKDDELHHLAESASASVMEENQNQNQSQSQQTRMGEEEEKLEFGLDENKNNNGSESENKNMYRGRGKMIPEYIQRMYNVRKPADVDGGDDKMKDENKSESRSRSRHRRTRSRESGNENVEVSDAENENVDAENDVEMDDLRHTIKHAYSRMNRMQRRIDLTRIIPDSELKRPVFHNKHAVETLEYMIQKNKGDIGGHIPWIVDAMEILLQRTRGLTTRDSPTFTPMRSSANNRKGK